MDSQSENIEYVKWAKNALCEMDRQSLMDGMEAARMQQDFARDHQHTPWVQNKVSRGPGQPSPERNASRMHGHAAAPCA